MCALANPELPVDLSELQGRKFVCLDECQLCCLCQPELLEKELQYFKRNFPDRLVARRSPHKHTALALKNGNGPCTFLDGGRCSIYPNRPHYCRQFPFHVYLGERVQVELDLSCRGVWLERGEDALGSGVQLLADNSLALRRGLDDSREVYRSFKANCAEAGIVVEPEKLRKEFGAKLSLMTDPAFLGSILDRSMEEDEMTLSELPDSRSLDAKGAEELQLAAMETGLESLAAEDTFSAPIYCNPQATWNMFVSQDNELDLYQMDREGKTTRLRGIVPRKVPLLSPEGEGKRLFTDYLATLNRRDSLLGYAYYLIDDYGYDDSLSNVYYGALATSALDLLWRSSLLAYIWGGELDGEGMKEGIIFYDMDRLDAPTIGAFM
jgi:Fe-S-cluster containining protein